MNKQQTLQKLPLLIYSAAIFYMSNQQQPPNIIDYFWSMDKLLHFAAYFVYYFCSLFFFKSLNIDKSSKQKYTIITSMLFAVSDEFHQYFVPGRSAEFGDILADFAGILFGWLIYKIYHFIILKKNI